MKMKKIILITALFILSACANNTEIQATKTIVVEPTIVFLEETPTPPAYLPLSSDSHLTKAKVQIDSASLIFATGDPVQVELLINGYLPTPCHELRVHIPDPDEEGNIRIEIYSLTEPEILCEQVLRRFNEKVILGTYPRGSYLVWINGGMVGNFDF
jgi:hypothetical protein